MITPVEVKTAKEICRKNIQAAVDEFRDVTGFNVSAVYVHDAINGIGEIEIQAVTVEVKL